MNIDFTPVIQAVIVVLATLVTYRFVPWLKSKTTAQQQANLAAAVKVAVYAAEEVYRAGHGDEKLKYVQQWLSDKGFSVDVEQIRATVNQMRDEKVLANAVTVGVELVEREE